MPFEVAGRYRCNICQKPFESISEAEKCEAVHAQGIDLSEEPQPGPVDGIDQPIEPKPSEAFKQERRTK